jgi:hypothetical protein
VRERAVYTCVCAYTHMCVINTSAYMMRVCISKCICVPTWSRRTLAAARASLCRRRSEALLGGVLGSFVSPSICFGGKDSEEPGEAMLQPWHCPCMNECPPPKGGSGIVLGMELVLGWLHTKPSHANSVAYCLRNSAKPQMRTVNLMRAENTAYEYYGTTANKP